MTTTCSYPDGCTTQVPPDTGGPITHHPNTGPGTMLGLEVVLVIIGLSIGGAAVRFAKRGAK
jgi:hypothetical protein